ncbi:MAG: hypothetical protein IPJ76_15860 [Flavobacteriales bacterium]|nr:MAG: hypothetical protein IPJ76_15860 [Flavobacteriales bacterium]
MTHAGGPGLLEPKPQRIVRSATFWWRSCFPGHGLFTVVSGGPLARGTLSVINVLGKEVLRTAGHGILEWGGRATAEARTRSS